MYRVTGHRRGLWIPTEAGGGRCASTTTGRKSGRQREAILGYYEDGPNLVTMAMNGWGAAEPAWWLNLQAQPEATVRTKQGDLAVHGRSAEGDERDRLWARWQALGDDVDGYSTRRPTETAVVVLEPRGAQAADARGGERGGER